MTDFVTRDGGTRFTLASVTPIRPPVTIGGSSAAAACGIDPRRSRIGLWCELTGRMERRETEAMRWGTLLEPLIVEQLVELGFVSAYTTTSYDDEPTTDARHPWLVGHPDGYVQLGEDNEWALLEVKTAGSWSAREWADDAVPLPYVAQVQTYLHLTGLERALLACLVGGQKLELRTVTRDDRAIARMLALMEEFVGYVERDEPPPPDDSESARDALAALYPGVKGERVRLLGEDWQTYRELVARREQEAAVKAQRVALENRLKARMGDATEAISPWDDVVLRWTPSTRTALDTAKVRAEFPEVYDACKQTTETRRFSVD